MRNNFDSFIKDLVNISSIHCESQENPKAIITLGEKGSGKEVLALQAQDELSQRGGSVLIGTDYFKSHTENYLSSINQNDNETTKNSEQEAKFLSNKVLEHAIENKKNIVINENEENPYNFKDVTDKLHNNGYEVDLRVMSTPHDISLLRSNTQYEEQKGNLGFGNHTSIKSFDSKNLENILEVAESEKLVDKVKVYDRVGNQTYSNELNPDKETWLKEPGATDNYTFEVNKPLSKSEYQYNQVNWEQLVHMKVAAKAPKEEIDKVIAEKEFNQNKNLEKDQVNKDISQLVIKAPELYKGIQTGELVDHDESHLLMKINRFTAIRYEKDRLPDLNDQELEIGQQLYFNHGNHGDYHMLDQQQIQDQQQQEQERQISQAQADQDFQQDLMR